ncbi:bifunctional glycosyltransferase family 2/GtrA family protein [Streptomyces sp. NBC_00257]|uniref:glycosyltransferase n=1 Tax=unclassified Streptomyces TaxID=2593676 RepID=UPI00225A50E1|nr:MULTISPECIES: glycosyltransferase [unclassified Streptomyces]WTB60004.1 bifunctional glycosyltransferase family 2/GtrA family protein [Streptomyces sp. NBC_00826]WTH95410.1 bifunctional glycosyltransferase family 2/GtrA family protein [Streptomyces sp. NBC_00825]WTI04141.1 bifunctional glycosyltransferase family 2/GtrA family protein [Streptomyces sp. NBC_00822]MCX4870038.1 bifunctional glycosyltransferase family 2/GtrA family protein [Streptomyces sp. NBC_00906]MCX4901201.1 bifunctional gl
MATHHPEPVLDVVIPVFNEERDLEPSVRRLHTHLRETFPYPFRITIADNASTDSTPQIAARLADELPEAQWLRLTEKGRGRALRTAWSLSPAPVLAYMDVDLSTELTALLPLVAPLLSGHSDIAIGTRLAPGSRVVRGPKREITSRCYNVLLRSVLAVRFSDAQCGFKAVRRDVAERLLPLIQDSEWFFDTELLVIAERAGLRIHEVPVDWVDDPDTRVDILATALADLRGIARVSGALARGTLPSAGSLRDGGAATPGGITTQLLRFTAVGAVSTLVHLLLYTTLRPVAGAQAANALALLICAVANTAVNRRLTFGLRGRGSVLRHQGRGLFVLLIGLAITGGSLTALHHAMPSAGQAAELAVLLAANLAATLLRFLLFRVWVFRA